jgi:TolB-like protein
MNNYWTVCGYVLVAALISVAPSQGGQTVDTNLQNSALRVAVLPFVNISGSTTDQWIGNGIAATLESDLQRQYGVTILNRNIFTSDNDFESAAGAEISALKLSREVDATWLIVGGYQIVGTALRITTRLLEVETSTVVAATTIDGRLDELFSLQDQIVETLGANFSPKTASQTEPTNPEHARGDTTTPLAPPNRIISGPPPPVPPETISRDAEGRATIRAIRVENLTLDGVLNEPVYQEIPPAAGFIQQEPVEGAPATEQTELWVLFDDENVYLSLRCWNSAPESEWIVNEMRRDSVNVAAGEFVGVLFDTFYDRRSGVNFGINPIGGRLDSQLFDERDVNMDWNPIWDLRTGRFDGGWIFEAAFPFKSLRYRPGRSQVWGLNIMRNVQWKNERSFLVPIPAARGQGGIMHVSLAATVVGLEAPEDIQRLEIKPYAISDLTSDFQKHPPRSNDLSGDVGLDVKYGLTQNLVADLTVNTDFAQVEADEQQVNLTRFSLFFPEKREFFLENQGLFAFGGTSAGPFGLAGDTPILFYSRQIGLDDGHEVPIDVGGRLTGRVGPFSVGVLNLQTGNNPTSVATATNFSVVRLKRDVLRRSSIGALFTRRSVSRRGNGSNETYGLDGTFGFFDNLHINTYWAKTETAGLEDDISYRAQLDYDADRYGVQLERLVVGTDFNPEVGFLRREDFERNVGMFRFSPRLRSIAAIRKLSWQGRLDYTTTRNGALETREAQGRFRIEFENSDRFDVEYSRNYEFLDEPFKITPEVTIPIGGYSFQKIQTALTLGRQRRLAGTLAVQHGSFFSGDRTSADLSYGRLEITRQLSLEPGLSFNWIDLPEGYFTTELITTRTTYTLTPLMFVSALLQYNSSHNSLATNLRFRWEYQPGSELFVVYNDQRDTLAPRFPELENRSFVVKVTRLLQF